MYLQKNNLEQVSSSTLKLHLGWSHTSQSDWLMSQFLCILSNFLKMHTSLCRQQVAPRMHVRLLLQITDLDGVPGSWVQHDSLWFWRWTNRKSIHSFLCPSLSHTSPTSFTLSFFLLLSFSLLLFLSLSNKMKKEMCASPVTNCSSYTQSKISRTSFVFIS